MGAEVEEPDRVDLVTDPPADGRREALRELFPEAFPEGIFDPAAIAGALGDPAGEAQERYGLSWAGRAEAQRAVQRQSVATVHPDRASSVDFDSASDVIIEGDNLEVLRLLQRAYNDRVKLCYVDPPYNTGGDFIYPDNFREGLATYLEFTRQISEEGYRLSSNTETSGRYHSAWLRMIYPRLVLARNLLTRDGFIVVSIDDAEVANLRLVMDEVFGVENFVATLVWDRNRKNDAKLFSVGHEYMHVYARDKKYLAELGTVLRADKPGVDEVQEEFDRLRGVHGDDWEAIRDGLNRLYASWEEDDPRKPLARYQKVDERGPHRTDGDVSWPGGGGPRYEVLHPVTGKPCKIPKRGWVFSEPERMQRAIEEGEVVFGVDETTIPGRRSYMFESDEQVLPSVQFSYAQTASQKFDELFDNQRVFDNPKHFVDLATLVEYLTDADDLVLDFFAGSGSLGHGVLHANKKNRSARRYLLVQLPEPVNESKPSGQNAKAMGLNTIADICRERIVRSIQREYPSGDGPGFRYYRLGESNFELWDAEEAAIGEAELAQQLQALEDNLRDSATDDSIAAEILLKEGVSLDVPLERHEIAGAEVIVGGGRVAVSLARTVTQEHIDGLVGLGVPRVVMLEVAFNDGNDEMKSNAFYSLSDANIVMKTA